MWPTRALVAFPLVMLVSDLLRVGTSEETVATLIRDVGAHPDRWFAGTLVGMTGLALAATGAGAIADRTRAASPWLTGSGLGLVVLGAYSGVVLMTTDLLPWMATHPQARPGGDALVDLVFGQHVLAPFYGLASCFNLGFALLAAALWRSSPADRAAAAALFLAQFVFLAGRAANTDPLRFAGDVAFLVAVVLIATGQRRAR